MKLKQLIIILPALFFLIFSGCKFDRVIEPEWVPEFNPLVAAYTSGIISTESAVTIRLAQNFTDSVSPNSIADRNLMVLSPDVEGTIYYIDSRTLEFRPAERFKPGTSYRVKVKLSGLTPVSADNKQFEFGFRTLSQSMGLMIEGFRPYNDYEPGKNTITGIVNTADVADPVAMQSVLKVMQQDRALPVSWDHSDNGREHRFVIDSVLRSEKEETVTILYKGSLIGAEQEGEELFTVPPLGSFHVIGHRVVQYPEQHMVISFSDPIMKNQFLDGLIRLQTDTDLKFVVEGNNILAFPEVRQNGTVNLFIEPGIKNITGKTLEAGEVISVVFEEIKPAVELLGHGVIIPASAGVLLPFKAVNLKAVDLKVIKIYEDNIAQFLQVNELPGSMELKRAGRLILNKRVDLFSEKSIHYGEWNTFSLNLTDLVRTEPGAIYRVELGFRKAYSLYPCGDDDPDEANLHEQQEQDDPYREDEMSYWDSYESYHSNYDYYYYDGYEWEDREDPCKEAYYGHSRTVSRNVLASNLGLIAKRGSGEQLLVTVTDLLEAVPLTGIPVKVYNFQQQLLAEGSTDNHGTVRFDLNSVPFLVVAESSSGKGYLKLNDGSALSYSMFDVSGTSVHKGLKGFIYGERGVWRPGDSIFISFILDDKANPVPDDHPVLFELMNPRGKIVKRAVDYGRENGFYSFHTATEADALTGSYTVYAKIGGATFTKSLNIETIKPNRLKIELSFADELLKPHEGPVRGFIKSRWLTGATAGNLKAEVEVSLRSRQTAFRGFEGYDFEDPSKELYSYPVTFFSGYLDESGTAQVSKRLEITGKAPGMLNAVFTSRVFEKSGDFSIDQIVVPCSPYQVYSGIKVPEGDQRGALLTDTLHTIDVVTVDENGQRVGNRKLRVSVYKLDWRWWYESSPGELAAFLGSNYQALVQTETIFLKQGSGSFSFKIDYPEWGRYFIHVEDETGGHAAGKVVFIDWPGWAGRAGKGEPDAAAVLAFSTGKSTYSVGEKAVLNIPSSNNGRILVSIENGSGVLKQEWIEATGSETTYSFEVTSGMTPNVYVYASLIQPHASTENDLPIRMFGVIPIMVEDPATKLKPIIEMPGELSPSSQVKLKVSEANRREMTYTIAMVDEGLLDLTRFKTPDPWSHFYAREALGVKTWDIFDQVLGAYGGRIDGIYNIGGGEEGAGVDRAREANRFPPVVKFLGPFTLKARSNTHTIAVPNYIGSVRTMVIAGTKGAYGWTEKTTPVRQPLMVLATLPRVLGPGEESNLPVNVFVMDDRIKDVDVTVSAEGVTVIDEKSKHLQFGATGDKIVDFKLRTPLRTGTARVNVSVTSEGEKAEYHLELNIRSSNPRVVQYETFVMNPGESATGEIAFAGMKGTNDLSLEVSGIPPIDFDRRLKFLLQYPHGCIEQVTSAAFPQLYLADVVDVPEAVRKKTEKNIKEAIKKLAAYQLSDGSFSYWPGRTTVSSWGTSYAGHFLAEAADKGFDIPGSLMENWKKYQRKEVRRWTLSGKQDRYEIKQEQIMQAYRLFTLSLVGEAELGAMNRMRERTDLVSGAKWRLAAAYALAGQEGTARELAEKASVQVDEYDDSGYTFGSGTRDRAMILEAMVLMNMRNEAVPLLEMVSGALSDQQWMSTQTAAYSLVAVAKYIKGTEIKGNLKFDYRLNGGASHHAETGLSLCQINLDPGDEQMARIELKNNSERMIFVRIINNGIPPPGKEQAYEENLKLGIEYIDMDGNPINVSKIRQGTDFRVVYTLYNPGLLGVYENMALTAIFPSGWEIHNERLFNTTQEVQSFHYQDIRDDRVMTYFNLGPRETKIYTIRLNAAYKGRFYLPSVKAGEMYRHNIQALVPGQWIEVTEAE
ncbi:MAG: hypothetical protein JXR52_10225 [Bacteroidales bacterium]|nr:hypothetical protein [Bacteroidales bacterium]MBN2699189.1 hypothetical protein [Bacteroidales bacterium]